MEFDSFENAIKKLKASIQKSNCVENVAITEALGRILAVDVRADFNHPKRPTSAMDGYAVKFCDLKDNAKIKIISQTPAGSEPNAIPKNAECVKTFTGALMADGTDTLLPIENVDVVGDEIIVKKLVPQGFAVRKIGESYKNGELLIAKDTKLGFSQIALLAELGRFSINVYVRPKVAVLASGSEIKELGVPLENDAQIHSSNHIALANLVRVMGCEPIVLPIVKDDENELRIAIDSALASCDILITSGGVSVGDFDFVKTMLKSKFQTVIDGVAIKPGRHVKIFKFGEKYIFALPGFPLSAITTCILFLGAFLHEKFGVPTNYEISAILNEDYEKKSKFLEFSPATLSMKNATMYISTNNKKHGSSAILNNLSSDSVLLIAPLEISTLKKGEIVRAIRFPSF